MIFADRDAGWGMHDAEHRDQVLCHGDVFAEPDGAEERDQVAADRGVVGCRDVAEEVDHIVAGLPVETHVAEKDDNVAIHHSTVVDVAEEAHGIVDWGVGSDFNVVEELNGILVRVGGAAASARAAPKRQWARNLLCIGAISPLNANIR